MHVILPECVFLHAPEDARVMSAQADRLVSRVGAGLKKMVYAVFLCDREWKIKKIQQCREALHLKENDILTDVVREKEMLSFGEEKEETQYALNLTFTELKQTLQVVIQTYREGSLVVEIGRAHV